MSYTNIEKRRQRMREYYAENIKRLRADKRRRYKENHQQMMDYLSNNREHIYSRRRANYRANLGKNRAINRAKSIKRRSTIAGKIEHCLWRRLNEAVPKEYRIIKIIELLGCTVEIFRKHIESLFKPGMSWENYGFHGWHMDHIVPINRFDLSDAEQQRKCFHYSNLRPLWREEHMRRSHSENM